MTQIEQVYLEKADNLVICWLNLLRWNEAGDQNSG